MQNMFKIYYILSRQTAVKTAVWMQFIRKQSKSSHREKYKRNMQSLKYKLHSSSTMPAADYNSLLFSFLSYIRDDFFSISSDILHAMFTMCVVFCSLSFAKHPVLILHSYHRPLIIKTRSERNTNNWHWPVNTVSAPSFFSSPHHH